MRAIAARPSSVSVRLSSRGSSRPRRRRRRTEDLLFSEDGGVKPSMWPPQTIRFRIEVAAVAVRKPTIATARQREHLPTQHDAVQCCYRCDPHRPRCTRRRKRSPELSPINAIRRRNSRSADLDGQPTDLSSEYPAATTADEYRAATFFPNNRSYAAS